MHRFYVPHARPRDGKLQLTGPVYEQIRRVLRMRPGDAVAIFDGTGREYQLRLLEFGKGEVYGQIIDQYPVATEPRCQVEIYLSLLNKSDKFEWALQKCTELGATHFVPVVAARSVTASGRHERWERIIQEAVEQSGRGALPILEDPIPLAEALDAESDRMDASGTHVVMMPALGADLSLSDALVDAHSEDGSVSIFIGPEGGFSDDELFAANKLGILLVNLGPRTLRAETAATAALALTMYELGEMGLRSDTMY